MAGPSPPAASGRQKRRGTHAPPAPRRFTGAVGWPNKWLGSKTNKAQRGPAGSDMTKSSKATSVEILACDAGWRNYHFVKLTTEDGIVGWSEFDEGFGS